MSITSGEMTAFGQRETAQGYVTQFGRNDFGMCYFDYWFYTYPSGRLVGQWVRVRPMGQLVVTPSFDGGAIKVLPGGRVYNPWYLATARIPTYHPVYSQRLLYFGHSEPVMIEYKKLQKYVGLTSMLELSYGEIALGAHGPKSCPATLLPFSGAMEHKLPDDMLAIEFAVQWQQVGDFVL